MSKGESLDESDQSDSVEFESKSEKKRGARLTRLFQKGYTRRNKDASVVPPSNSSTPLDDTITPSDDCSKINSKLHVLSPITSTSDIDSNPVASEIAALNPKIVDRRLGEPDRLGFSKSSSNIVCAISDFISYHRLSKTHLIFGYQLSYVSSPNHFQEVFGDPKLKAATLYLFR